MIFGNVLLPLILILALGFILGKSRFLGKEFIFGLNRLVFYVGLPALVVHSLATARLEKAAVGLFAIFALVTLLGAGLSLILSRVLRLPPLQVGAFVQASFRGNLAYVAIPVLLALFQDHPDRARIMALALLVLGPSMVLFNVVSAFVLMPQGSSDLKSRCWKVMKMVGLNPLVLASLTGLLLALTGLPLPSPVDRTLGMIGAMSVPAALLCVGAVMALVHIGPSWKPSLFSALIKVGISPLIGWCVGRWVGLEPWAFTVLLVFCSCPTAVASYVMAVQMGGDEGIASQTIVFSTVLCFIPLSLILMV